VRGYSSSAPAVPRRPGSIPADCRLASLSYLGRLPVKIIRIDRSFVMGMTSTAGSTAIVRSIIKLSHSLGLRVVAEGVETGGANSAGK
jgi:EAL domain-containing protein (putative c-di-GMP-specific phosphodiesterase class I)